MDSIINYFVFNNKISTSDKDKLNLLKGTGYAKSTNTFYIKGQQTTLDFTGSGFWKQNFYKNGLILDKQKKDITNSKINKLDINYFFDFVNNKLVESKKLIDRPFYIENEKTTLDEEGCGFTERKDPQKNGWYFLGKLIHTNYSGWCDTFNVYFIENKYTNLNKFGFEIKNENLYIKNIKILNIKPKHNIDYISISPFDEKKFTGWASTIEGASESLFYFYDIESKNFKYTKNKGTFYINGIKTTLNEKGSGIIFYPADLSGIYVNGIKTNLDIYKGGIWDSKKYKIGGILDESFNGSYDKHFFINGEKTTLDEQGSGLFDNKFYYKGKIIKEFTGFLDSEKHKVPNTLAYDNRYYNGTFYFKNKATTLNRLGCGVWDYNLKPTYFLYGKPTSLSAYINKNIKHWFDNKTGSYKTNAFGFGVWDDKTGEKIYQPPNIKNLEDVNFLIPTPVLNKKIINGFIPKELGASEFSSQLINNGCWYIEGVKTPLNNVGVGFWSVSNGGKMNSIQKNLDLEILLQINLLLGTYYTSYIGSSNHRRNVFAIPTNLDESGSGYWKNDLFDYPFWVKGKNISNYTGWISSIAGAPPIGYYNSKVACKQLDIYNSILSDIQGAFFENGKMLNFEDWAGYSSSKIDIL